MGSSRWLHASWVVACAYGVAAGQPAPGKPGDPAVRPAGASAVESSDVPPYKPSPPRFAVAPFENHSEARSLDWLVAGAPFEIAEKTEDVLGLEPTGGTLRVGSSRIEPEPEPVLELATRREADYVITGWVDRYNWNLRIALTLWKVNTGKVTEAVVVAEAQRTGEPKAYHQLLGDALAQLWSKGANIQIDVDRKARLARPLSHDLYAVNLLGRGVGHLTGALGEVNLKAALGDLEKAVFIDPKLPEAQRVLGEVYQVLATADPKLGGNPRLGARATGKFAYAYDLAPTNLAVMRAAATGAARAGKHEIARDILRKLVTRKPWDLDARFDYGAALWGTGDDKAAEKQLSQVTAQRPDHLPSRRVLVLIHASRGDTSKLVDELEAIALRAPADLDVKADLATAYASVGRWDRASAALEQIAAARPNDLALLVRIGDTRRRMNDVDGALAWYGRAQRVAPELAMPGFLAAQTLFDAGRMPDAIRAYTNLQKHRDERANAEHALGAIALLQDRASDAAWYLRRAVKSKPRVVAAWRSLIAAELARKDTETALRQLERALAHWPGDGPLLYLAGITHAMAGSRELARERLDQALAASPGLTAARAALGKLDLGAAVTLEYKPELPRPWGDADAIGAAIERYTTAEQAMARARDAYQGKFLKLLAALGKGPLAPIKQPAVRRCPIDRVAPLWAAAQDDLRRYERLGVELEGAHRFIARHDDLNATAALLPNARARVATIRKAFRVALADVSELRAQWVRGLVPELRFAGCTDKLLVAAVAEPERYRVIQRDQPAPIPQTQPPRPKPRATFYVDNTSCADPVDVWIDGTMAGQIAPGARSALVTDGGERTLCLIVPGSAQCGDRGTVRQVYLHDGWTTTIHCPK
jgi:tetratricopeptide (TPR) repeat protein/TolB-like protein